MLECENERFTQHWSIWGQESSHLIVVLRKNERQAENNKMLVLYVSVYIIYITPGHCVVQRSIYLFDLKKQRKCDTTRHAYSAELR